MILPLQEPFPSALIGISILGIDDFVIPLLLSNPSELTGADKLQVFAWLNKGRSMDPNVIRLLLGETTGDMDLREMYLGIGDDLVPELWSVVGLTEYKLLTIQYSLYCLKQYCSCLNTVVGHNAFLRYE